MTRSWLRAFGVILVGGAALARPAHATPSTKNFFNYCLTGSIRTCASVTVQTTLSGGGTNVVISIRNLQGTNPNDNTGGSILTALGLTYPPTGTGSSLVVTTSGTVGTGGTPLDNWHIVTNGGGLGNIEFQANSFPGTKGGILGCNNGYNNAVPSDYFRTCDSQGNTGWVVFSFHTANAWDASAAEIAWKVQSVAATGLSYECRSQDPLLCDPPVEITATPEPMTIMLLGSGLAGMGGLGAVRRRKREGAIE